MPSKKKETQDTYMYRQTHMDIIIFTTLINGQSTNFAAAITTFTSTTSDLLP